MCTQNDVFIQGNAWDATLMEFFSKNLFFFRKKRSDAPLWCDSTHKTTDISFWVTFGRWSPDIKFKKVVKSFLLWFFFCFWRKKITVYSSKKKARTMTRIFIINFGSPIDQHSNHFRVTWTFFYTRQLLLDIFFTNHICQVHCYYLPYLVASIRGVRPSSSIGSNIGFILNFFISKVIMSTTLTRPEKWYVLT